LQQHETLNMIMKMKTVGSNFYCDFCCI